MAAKTVFTKEDFKTILQDYDLGNYVESIPFELGADQTNILLTTTQGKFAFRYYEKRSEEYVLFEIDLLKYLATRSFPCPEPIENIHNTFLGIYNNNPYALFTFLEGEHSNSESNGKKVAEILAQLHTLTLNYKPVNYEARDRYDKDYCWKNSTETVKTIPSEAEVRLKWLQSELNKLEIPNDLPKGVCHGDTNPSNFLYKNDKLVAVLDFDQASYTYLLYDIAHLLYWWAWPDKEELGFIKAIQLLDSYRKHRKLTNEEETYLYDILKLVILISISWSFDTADYLNGRRKIEFINTFSRTDFSSKLFKG